MGVDKSLEKLKFIAPSWEMIFSLSVRLAEKIRSSEPTTKFDLIVGVSRGGLVATRLMSDLLSIETVQIVRSEYYSDVGKTRQRPRITQKIQVPIAGKKVLLVDDVSDTGESLIEIKKYLAAKQPKRLVLSTLYIKPWTKIMPDYYAASTDAWIVFPWERLEAVKSLNAKGGPKLLAESKLSPKIIARLQDYQKKYE
jgi:uncharacterized protein